MDANLSPEGIEKPTTPDGKAKAEDFTSKGTETTKKKQYHQVVDLDTEAMRFDLTNAVYRANKICRSISMEKLEDADEDACLATHLDPKYPQARARPRVAELKLGDGKRARDAYKTYH
jgi:hypothetical protein